MSGSSFRVLRGGGWSYDARNCRSAYRVGLMPGYRVALLGFRPVRRAASNTLTSNEMKP